MVKGDVNNLNALGSLVEGAKAVINVGGPTDALFGNTSHVYDYKGTKNLIAKIKEKKPDLDRLIYISTTGLNGWRSFAMNLTLGNYATWKAAAEKEIRESGLPYVIIRPGKHIEIFLKLKSDPI
jgi:nucleoside-diphosphate-sugar epimerase